MHHVQGMRQIIKCREIEREKIGHLDLESNLGPSSRRPKVRFPVEASNFYAFSYVVSNNYK